MTSDSDQSEKIQNIEIMKNNKKNHKKRKIQKLKSSDTDDSDSDDQIPKNVLKPKKKTKRKSQYDPKEESRLERLVFADPNDVIENILNNDSELGSDEENNQKIHKNNNESSICGPIQNSSDVNSETTVREKEDKVAWVDEDDEYYSVAAAAHDRNKKIFGSSSVKMYKKFLESKFAHIVGTPKWAQPNFKNQDSDDSDHEILKHSNIGKARQSKLLPKSEIDLKVVTLLNTKTYKEGPFVNSVQFHKTSTVAMVAGSSGVVSLFEVDGKENNVLHTLRLPRFPIRCARFIKDDSEILMGCMKDRFCYTYDLLSGATRYLPLPHGINQLRNFEVSLDGKVVAACGRLGEIHLISSHTKELISSLKMNKKCRALAFSPDGEKLISHGETNEVHVWDLRSRLCTNKPIDDGCLTAASVAISPSGQYVATGSKQGVVNIYNAQDIYTEKYPQPLKTVLNLVTSITKLKFNPSSEILACASDKKPNAFKMVHLPSFTVFSNFPTFNTIMKQPLDIDFSPGSGFMSVTNNNGSAYLYRLRHYGNY